MPNRTCNHKSLCALEQDLHAPGMRARLNAEPLLDRYICYNSLGLSRPSLGWGLSNAYAKFGLMTRLTKICGKSQPRVPLKPKNSMASVHHNEIQ